MAVELQHFESCHYTRCISTALFVIMNYYFNYELGICDHFTLILKKTVHNKICSIYSSLHFCPNAFLYSPSANVIERINFK